MLIHHEQSLKTALTFVANTAQKTIFPFCKCSEKMIFPKNCTGIWSFLYHQEREYFFSPKIWSYYSGGKWKIIFLKKICGNMIYSSNVLKTLSLQKNHTGILSFFYHQERWHFCFFAKIWYFFYERKMKDDLSQKILANIMFSVCSV